MEEEKVTELTPRVVQHMTEFDTTFHPGVDPKDLVHAVHGTVVSELKNWRSAPPNFGEIFCHNCGLDDNMARNGYTSRVKITYIRQNNAIWELGGPDGPWLLKDEINVAKDGKSVDYTSQKFLRDANIGIPLVEMYRFGGGDEKFHFTMMSRAKGKPLEELKDICDEQYNDLLMDLKNHIKSIRQFTSPHMRRVDGGELYDNYIGKCYGFPCVNTGRNEEEWLENLTPAMRKAPLWKLWLRNKTGRKNPKTRDAWIKWVDEQIDKAKADFPKGGPYVLTHGDLHDGNIYGSNDNADQKWKVTAIIDWETAGYYPWWVELLREPRLLSGPGTSEEKMLEFCPPTFKKEDWAPMLKAIERVRKLYEAGGGDGHSIHGKGGANRWYSKEFCECHKVRKTFLEWNMGWPQEHHDVFEPELSDPDDDPEKENLTYKYDFDKEDREFLRWYNTIGT
ncbi:uncharacterized protein Bfra_008672 [Botrytis fragariae]|uniref:Aminoglycoside phosphotransferase domain-containing protein n=1 Tax=Botrytis fragariae TaxID=1964551 RepID=A0A8H6EGM4_9HELO|nr:uncharacterized protein Bfra_008672 [Botrytis fragariae]KAF5871649.1 hypothetical protein Bfra_008672 [Botrytis fragariae]